eukprot:PITA_23625
MLSRNKFPLVKVEAEQGHALEEEEEAHIEVEEATLQTQVEEAAIKIQVKAQAKIKHKVRSMINLKFNVITMTNNRMFPLKVRSDLKEEGAQEQLSMNSLEDGRKQATVTQVNFHAEVKDENWLWHLRFGHLNFIGLILLHRKGVVKGLPLIEKPDNLCEGCILGKQHRETFLAGSQ